ncbi:protein AMBP [Pseudoliparis swirei]|uniref:protein AMBP n=1 Tax=Pseudoliparis swirei TaxID=2059687 RepID=UPI0024BD83C9|nr:protein AMBP [Pseudoliparis swirei]
MICVGLRGCCFCCWLMCLKVLLPECSVLPFFPSCYLSGPSSVTLSWSLLLSKSRLRSLGVPVRSCPSYLALSGTGPVNRSQLPNRSRPAPEQLLAVKGEEGRELHVVVNTNDPDYEHIYSIQSYNNNPLDELLYFTASADLSDGEVDKDENIKTIAVQPKKSARADVKKKVKAVGQKAAKVTPLKARSIRIKRSVQGEAPADLCLLPMEEGNCGQYTLRWYFNSQVQACRPFIYSGCEGNNNRFLQQEECEELCLGEAKGPHPLKTAR